MKNSPSQLQPIRTHGNHQLRPGVPMIYPEPVPSQASETPAVEFERDGLTLFGLFDDLSTYFFWNATDLQLCTVPNMNASATRFWAARKLQ